MKHPGATVVQVIGGLMVAATVTPVIMGLGAVTPWLILIFVLGLVLLYAGSRMRRSDEAPSGVSEEAAQSAAPAPDREVSDEDLDAAGINRAPDGTPTSPGVDEQSGIKGM